MVRENQSITWSIYYRAFIATLIIKSHVEKIWRPAMSQTGSRWHGKQYPVYLQMYILYKSPTHCLKRLISRQHSLQCNTANAMLATMTVRAWTRLDDSQQLGDSPDYDYEPCFRRKSYRTASRNKTTLKSSFVSGDNIITLTSSSPQKMQSLFSLQRSFLHCLEPRRKAGRRKIGL